MNRRPAIDMERNADHRLEGPCPACRQPTNITADTLPNAFKGTFASCQQHLAWPRATAPM